MTTPHYERVKKFMQLAKQETPHAPVVPSEDVRRLRAALILEEALETIEALGFYPAMIDKHLNPTKEGPNLIEIADGCADIAVVTTGTLIACGIKDVSLMELVDENNLAKFGPGHSYREDGKLIKPPNHSPPDIGKLLADQLTVGEPSTVKIKNKTCPECGSGRVDHEYHLGAKTGDLQCHACGNTWWAGK